LRAIAAALTEGGVPFEFLDRPAIASHFPQFALTAQAVGIFQRDAGVLHADRCVAALRASALSHGAELHENEAVHQIEANGTGVIVNSDSGRYRADRVVLAAGSRLRPLVQSLGLDLPLTTSKEQVAYFQPPEPEAFAPSRFPVFILHLGGGLLGSGFPLIRDHGVKIMIENKLEADSEDYAVDTTRLGRLNETIRPLVPGLGAATAQAETCRYTLTADEDFIIDHHPEHRQIIIASPCSGHGFKFAPLLGQAIADLADGVAPAIDIKPFRLDRPGLRAKGRARMSA
jgi:sarcosine oxidase